jgi:hypothetical protein
VRVGEPCRLAGPEATISSGPASRFDQETLTFTLLVALSLPALSKSR